MKEFNVLRWEINGNKLVPYDVLPYFRREYNELKKSERPTTREQMAEFVKRKGMYRYWSRCEYEIIISPWPNQDKDVKIDVWAQIEMNLDLVVDILMSEFCNESEISYRRQGIIPWRIIHNHWSKSLE